MVTKVLKGERGQALSDKLQNKRYSTERRIFQAQRIAPGMVLSQEGVGQFIEQCANHEESC